VSTFAWIGAFSPYMSGVSILVLGYAWYKKIKPAKTKDCICEEENKVPFTASKRFLGIVTLIAVLMLSYSMITHYFHHDAEEQHVTILDHFNISIVEFKISGLTCSGCENLVNREVKKLPWIMSSLTSSKNGNVIVAFEDTKICIDEIEKAINNTGFLVTEISLKSKK
jgi:mercuric ion transport protein